MTFLIIAVFITTWLMMSWFAEIKIIQASIITVFITFSILSLALHMFVDYTLTFDLISQYIKDQEVIELFQSSEGKTGLHFLAKLLTFPVIICCLLCLGLIQYRKVKL